MKKEYRTLFEKHQDFLKKNWWKFLIISLIYLGVCWIIGFFQSRISLSIVQSIGFIPLWTYFIFAVKIEFWPLRGRIYDGFIVSLWIEIISFFAYFLPIPV